MSVEPGTGGASQAPPPGVPAPTFEDLARAGWRLFPCYEHKGPAVPKGVSWQSVASSDPERIREWTRRYRHFAIELPADVVVVDLDEKNGVSGSGSIRAHDLDLPTSARATTPSGGLHVYYSTDEPLHCREALLPGVDIKTRGGYVLVPPSPGREWLEPLDRETLTEAPGWIVERLAAPAERPASEAGEPGRIPQGERNATLASLAGSMRRRGMEAEEILAALAVANERRCDPPLSDAEVERIARSVGRYPPADAPDPQPAAEPPVAVELRDLLSRRFAPRCWLLDGLAQERDSVMVHAFRGVGKTRFVHGVAYALASAGTFLRYRALEPHGVLIVDGELPREDLQQRLAETIAAADSEARAPFRILAADLLPDPLPSLATAAGQRIVEANLDGVSLVVLDNVSTLCGSGRAENDAESWEPIQAWLLRLRHQFRVAVLLVHHEGKGGSQRGTSKREDTLSTVVQLKRPAEYSPRDGCRFEVHVTKGRAVHGDAAEPFEAALASAPDGRRPAWLMKSLEQSLEDRVERLYEDGVTKQRDLAAELGVGLGSVNRAVKKLKAEGRILPFVPRSNT